MSRKSSFGPQGRSAVRVSPAALVLVALALLLGAPALAIAQAPARDSEVFLLATVHKRHADLPYFGFERFGEIVEAIASEVMVLELTPTELEKREAFASKQEYPRVLFPMLDSGDYRVYVSEPGEPLFAQITGPVGAANAAFANNRPDAAQALERYETALRDVLQQAYWRSPADLHSAQTAKVYEGLRALRDELIGRDEADNQKRWDRFTCDAVIEAARENPGRRILVVNGIHNHYSIARCLRSAPGIRAIEMEGWLRSNGF